MPEPSLVLVSHIVKKPASPFNGLLAFSKGPLRIQELAEAVLIDSQATSSSDQTEHMFDSHDMLKVLSSLVTVHTREEWHYSSKNRSRIEEIKLAHFSVKEYLIFNRPKPAGLAHFLWQMLPPISSSRIAASYI